MTPTESYEQMCSETNRQVEEVVHSLDAVASRGFVTSAQYVELTENEKETLRQFMAIHHNVLREVTVPVITITTTGQAASLLVALNHLLRRVDPTVASEIAQTITTIKDKFVAADFAAEMHRIYKL